jgi:hypothetical protein
LMLLLQSDDCNNGGSSGYEQPTDIGAKPVCKIPAEVHIRPYQGDPTEAMKLWADQTLSQREATSDLCQALYDSSVAISPATPDSIGREKWEEIHYDVAVKYKPINEYMEMKELVPRTKQGIGLHILSAECYSTQDEDEPFKKQEAYVVYVLFARTYNWPSDECLFDSTEPCCIVFHDTIKNYVRQANEYFSSRGFNLTLSFRDLFTRIVAHELCHQLALVKIEPAAERCCHDDDDWKGGVLCNCVLCEGPEFLDPMVVAMSEHDNREALRILLARRPEAYETSHRWPCVCESHRNMLRLRCSLQTLKSQFPNN